LSSQDPQQQQPAGDGGGAGAGEPSEQELRAAYEAELNRITATDMMAQAAVTLLNIGAHRLGPPGEQSAGSPGAPARDLEQAGDAIDGAKALLEILARRIPQEVKPLREALSRLQMAYAQSVREAPAVAGQEQPSAAQAPTQPAGQSPPGQGAQKPAGGEQPPGPGPAESSGRLWVPGR
jgi:hypothetical protein